MAAVAQPFDETSPLSGVRQAVAAPADPSGRAPGQILLGKYRLERIIGRGGMGVVWAAHHLGLDRRVALKFLLSDAALLPNAVDRFLREARATARLESEHVARVLDLGSLDDGTAYIVLEHLSGADLFDLLRRHGRLTVEEAVDLVQQACRGLAEAHGMGIVHRDLKPSNIFVAQRPDGTQVVKILDFGIAKAPETESWAVGVLTASDDSLIGSPHYMAPEQIRDTRSVDMRTDIWGLGIILHEALTGRHPFESNNALSTTARIVCNPPTTLRHHDVLLPEGLEQVVLRCLEKDQAKRFSTVSELALALTPFATDRAAPIWRRLLADTPRLVSCSAETVQQETPPFQPPTIVDPEIRGANGVHGGHAVISSERAHSHSAEPSPLSASLPDSSRESGPVTERQTRQPNSATRNFRRQHDELVGLAGEILQQLTPAILATNASGVRRLVARFAGKLSMHATMENEALYPRLIHAVDPEVRQKATSLFSDVKRIYDSFGTYSKRWPSPTAIEQAPEAFIEDTRTILKILGKRMLRENQELYPMVDALEHV